MKLPLEVQRALLTPVDRANYERLCHCIADKGRDAVGLVGAGVSQARYPAWGALLQKLHASARRHVDRRMSAEARKELAVAAGIDDPLIKAGIYERLLGRAQFRRLLSDSFASKSVGKDEVLPAAVVRLPFRYVFTTNYDDTLEQTYRRLRRGLPARELGLRIVDWSNPRHVAQLLEKWGEQRGRWYIHLHGSAAKPESMILTEADYSQRYLRSDATTRTLLTLLAFRTVVCLGFSLRDIDLMQVLRQIKSLRGSAAQHFALLGLEPHDWPRAVHRRSEYAEKYGVHPIFYRVGEGGDHRALVPLLNFISYQGVGAQIAARSAQENEAPIDQLAARLGAAWRDPLIADDPNKGAFGGAATRAGRRLSASVSVRGRRWYSVRLKVTATRDGRPLKGSVTFYTHTSFPRELWRQRVHTKRGVARVSFWAWGAFTVGAVVENEAVPLELDLAELADAPPDFVSA